MLTAAIRGSGSRCHWAAWSTRTSSVLGSSEVAARAVCAPLWAPMYATTTLANATQEAFAPPSVARTSDGFALVGPEDEDRSTVRESILDVSRACRGGCGRDLFWRERKNRKTRKQTRLHTEHRRPSRSSKHTATRRRACCKLSNGSRRSQMSYVAVGGGPFVLVFWVFLCSHSMPAHTHAVKTIGLFPRGPVELVEYQQFVWNATVALDLTDESSEFK